MNDTLWICTGHTYPEAVECPRCHQPHFDILYVLCPDCRKRDEDERQEELDRRDMMSFARGD